MRVTKYERMICCFIATIFLLMGVSAVFSVSNSFSLRTNTDNTTVMYINSVQNEVQDEAICTLSMLANNSKIIRESMSNSMMRGQYRFVLSFFLIASSVQYLFYYQSEESKEDGQLFSCRTLIVDYIHLKDSGE